MDEVRFDSSEFRKSSFSADAKECVEVAIRDGVVGVRDSKDVHSAVLEFTAPEWVAFVKGIKAGEFDIA